MNELDECAQYKAWWERDSKSLGTALNDLSMQRAVNQDLKAENARLRTALILIRDGGQYSNKSWSDLTRQAMRSTAHAALGDNSGAKA